MSVRKLLMVGVIALAVFLPLVGCKDKSGGGGSTGGGGGGSNTTSAD